MATLDRRAKMPGLKHISVTEALSLIKQDAMSNLADPDHWLAAAGRWIAIIEEREAWAEETARLLRERPVQVAGRSLEVGAWYKIVAKSPYRRVRRVHLYARYVQAGAARTYEDSVLIPLTFDKWGASAAKDSGHWRHQLLHITSAEVETIEPLVATPVLLANVAAEAERQRELSERPARYMAERMEGE